MASIKQAHAYWISPNGKIYDVGDLHINFIRDNLNLFKLTLKEYQETFTKYKEPFGWEGKAREELILNAIKDGWIRIRDYANKGWNVELWQLTNKTNDYLFDWSAKMTGFMNEVKENIFYNHYEINICELKYMKNGKVTDLWCKKTSFKKILDGELYEKKTVKFENFE